MILLIVSWDSSVPSVWSEGGARSTSSMCAAGTPPTGTSRRSRPRPVTCSGRTASRSSTRSATCGRRRKSPGVRGRRVDDAVPAGLGEHDLLSWFATPQPLEGDALEQVVPGVDGDADLLWVVEERIDGRDAPGPDAAVATGGAAVRGVEAGDKIAGTPPLRYWLTAPSPGPWHPYPARPDSGWGRAGSARGGCGWRRTGGRARRPTRRLEPAGSWPPSAGAGGPRSTRRPCRWPGCGSSGGGCWRAAGTVFRSCGSSVAGSTRSLRGRTPWVTTGRCREELADVSTGRAPAATGRRPGGAARTGARACL